MTFGQIRLIKWSLFAVLIGFGAYVGISVWRGVRDNTGAMELPHAESESLVSRQVEIEQLDGEGNTAWTLKAAESTGRSESAQRFREVEIRFNAGEERKPVVVTADHCRINKDESVHLRGNVIVRDETSLRLESDSLHFRRSPDLIWSTSPVRYFKEGLEGDAGNFRYFTKRRDLELVEGVSMVLEEEGDEPVRIKSKRAFMERARNWVQFIDDVRVRQGNRALDCNDLRLFLVDGTDEIEHMEAFGKVDLRMNVSPEQQSAEPEAVDQPAALSREPGLKRLLTDHLEVVYRPGGKLLDRVRALEGGRLIISLPEGEKKGYHKELEGYTLAFEFDEQGRLTTLRGRGGVTLILTPAGGGEKKTVTSRQLEADFDPESGDLLEARCERAVEFEQGDVRATAEQGTLRPNESKLVLRETPRLWDRRASLEANEIRIDIDSGDVEGLGNVRSTSESGEGSGLFPATDASPVHFVGHHLDYQRASDLAIYDGQARAFQGGNRIEADQIRLEQTKGELHAEGNVITIFLQSLAEEEGKKAEPTVTRAGRLLYRSQAEVLEYRRKVVMRSKELTLRGGEVDVILETGGSEVREIVARDEVEIETSEGKAGGEQARFLPKDDSMTVTGADAWLRNAGKLTEGKQLTFFLSDDRILVDGQEQNRTKTTYSSNPRPF